MRNEEGMTPVERELEATLATLAPAAARVDRDRVMFRAGRASAARRSHLWQGLTCILGMVIIVSVASRPQLTARDQHPERATFGMPSPPSQAVVTVDEDRLKAFRQYVRTRRAVLDRGVDAIPAPSEVRERRFDPPITRENLDDLLSST